MKPGWCCLPGRPPGDKRGQAGGASEARTQRSLCAVQGIRSLPRCQGWASLRGSMPNKGQPVPWLAAGNVQALPVRSVQGLALPVQPGREYCPVRLCGRLGSGNPIFLSGM